MHLPGLAAAIALTSCYDPNLRGVAIDGAAADVEGGEADSPPPPDAPLEVLTFGECACAMVRGVTTDALLDSQSPTTTFDDGAHMYLDSNPVARAVLRFELSAVPADARVVEARLHVSNATNSRIASGSVSLYALVEPWIEAQATWDVRMTGVPWASPGAGDASHEPDAAASFTPDVLGPLEHVVELPPALVAAWVRAPANNHGLVLLSTSLSGDGVAIVSSEGTVGDAYRPLLEVVFTR